MTSNDEKNAQKRQTPHTQIVAASALFDLGQIVATPGSLALLEQCNFSAIALLRRHVHGDWGDCDNEDAAANNCALARQLRVISVYRLVDPAKLAETLAEKRSALSTVWIITEADRSATTLLLPSEY